MSEVKAERVLPTGQRLRVVRGDITREAVDAIVNAANGWLAHGGGVAGAILRRAGLDLQLECDAWVERHGKLRNGEVAVSRGYALPAKRVIHAVGPIWHGGDEGEPEELRAAVSNSLDAAEKLDARSLSIPAISSGIFGFPKELCAEVMVDAALEWFAAHPGSALQELRFTNIDDPTVSVFYDEVERRLG